MIAAGGTAGHVLPALAVAEALTARGVHVTFAGSPDRVEAQLVPEAGYEFDTFRVSGFPRRPSLALAARARCSPARAPVRVPRDPRAPPPGRRPRRRRLRRRADGARRARRADPGGADRGRRAPRAREPARGAVRAARLPRLPARRARRRASTASSAGRSRRARARSRRTRRARSSSCPRTARCSLVFGALAGARALNELVVEAFGARRARPCCTSPASATTRRSRGACSRPDYRLIPSTDDFGAASRRRRPRARARRRLGLGDRGRRASPRSSSRTRSRPADHQAKNARYFARRAARSSCRTRSSTRVPGARRCAARRPGAARARWARRCCAAARPDAADEIAEELIALAARSTGRRLWFVGIGGAGLSRYALLARAWGAEVGGWDRVETPYLAPLREAGIEVELAPERRACPAGWEVGRLVARTRSCRRAARAREFLAELVVAAPVDRRRRHARQGDDAAMIAFVPRRDRPRPGLADRRAGAAARRERRRRGGLARRRGRRVRPHGRLLAPARSPCHERRARPPREFASLAELEAQFERWLARGAARRARLGARAGGARARRAGRAQPAERRRRARRARARRRPARRGREPRSRASAARPALRGRSEAGGVRSSTTTRHHPAEIAATIAAAARARPGRGVLVALPAAPLLAHAAPRPRARRGARRPPTTSCVTDVYPAREEPVAGVTRQARRRRALRPRPAPSPGRPTSRTRRASSPARAAGRRRAGRSAPATSTGAVAAAPGGARVRIEEGVPLARLTTIGTGGPARAFARPRDARRARGGARLGGERGLAGRDDRARLEPARRRRGRRRARRSARRRARRGRDRRRAARRRRRRGERRLPAPRARRRARRLRVRLRDPRHGRRRRADERGRLRQRLARGARVGRSSSTAERLPAGSTRTSSSSPTGTRRCARPGRRAGRFRLAPAPEAEIKAGSPSCTRSARRPSRRTSARSAASSRTPPTSRAPARMIEACGLKGHRIGGARDLAAPRELHREHRRRDERRRARADGRGAPARARAVRRRARARGRFLGASSSRAVGGDPGGELSSCLIRSTARHRVPRRRAPRRSPCARSPASRRPISVHGGGRRAAKRAALPRRGSPGARQPSPVAARRSAGRAVRPVARGLRAPARGRGRRLRRRARDLGLRGPQRSTCAAARRGARRGARGARAARWAEPARARRRRRHRRVGALPDVALGPLRPRVPAHAPVTVTPERPVAVLRRGRTTGSSRRAARGHAPAPPAPAARLPRLWLSRAGRRRARRHAVGRERAAPRARSRRSSGVGSRCASPRCETSDGSVTLLLRSGLELRLGDSATCRLKLAIAQQLLRARPDGRPASYLDVSVPERPVSGTNPQVAG